jgi:hypothetical protein
LIGWVWRKLGDEDIHSSGSLPNIRTMKLKKIRWTEHVIRSREIKKSTRNFGLGKPEGTRLLRQIDG